MNTLPWVSSPFQKFSLHNIVKKKKNRNLITENLYRCPKPLLRLMPNCFFCWLEMCMCHAPLVTAHTRGPLFSKLFTIVKQAGHGFCGQRSF